MKKRLVLFCLVGALCLKSNAAAPDLVNLGLVSQLVEIKYVSEAWLSRVVADTAKTKCPKDSALVFYNDVRIQLDRIIYQMTADMVERNSVKIYRQLNRYYTKHPLSETNGAGGAVLPYVLALSDLHNSFKTTINPDRGAFRTEFLSAATMLSIVNTGWTVLKGIKEQRGKKVDGIVEILNNLRLNAPGDLLKGKK